MNVNAAAFFAGVIVGAVLANIVMRAITRRARRRAMLETVPMPDSVVYRNAQSVADWHRKRLEQRLTE